LLANSGCPTLIGFESGRNEKEITDCKIKIKQILSVIKSDPRIDAVFISTRGPVYMHGEIKGEFTNASVSDSLLVSKNSKLTYSTYSKGLERTLDQLVGIGSVKNIYYLLENPELDFLPKETIVRPFDMWGLTIQDASVGKDLYLLRMKSYRAAMREVASDYESVTILDPSPYLCDQESCFAYKDGNFLYADDDHFSVFGASYIAKKISEEIF
jgi:hypothetical protein